MKLWGKLVCAVTRKHKRGRRVMELMPARVGSEPTGEFARETVAYTMRPQFTGTYECPRCETRWQKGAKP